MTRTAHTTVISGAATGISGPEGIGLDTAGNIYVSNRNGTVANPLGSVSVFAPAASGNAAPTRTIGGVFTLISAPQQMVVNPGGDFYVANGGNSTVNYFVAGASGNVAPTRSLNAAPGGNFPLGLALDTTGNIYVASISQINVYAPGASGAAVPTRAIAGAATTILFIEGIAVDAAGNIYASDCNVHAILVFGPAANGNVAPIRTISGAATTLT